MTGASDGDSSSSSREFQFTKLLGFGAWVAFLFVMSSFFVYVEIVKEGFLHGVLFAAIFFPFTIIAAVVGFSNLSNIVIDDEGISRSFLRRTWKVIPWNDVEVIRVFKVLDRRSNSEIRYFNIYPRIVSGFRIMPSGKMVFGERMERPNEFNTLLRKYIALHGLRVEGDAKDFLGED
jgi:hypothetical protein